MSWLIISSVMHTHYLSSPIDKELSYDHLASGLKDALLNDKSAFDADRLQKYTGIKLILHLMFSHCTFLTHKV